MSGVYKLLQQRAKELGISPFGRKGAELEAAIEDIKNGVGPFKPSKSSIIRSLRVQGKSTIEICKETGYKYSLVYNVLRRDEEAKKPRRKKVTISAQIRSLHDQGLSNVQIRDTLRINYPFVYGVVERYEKSESKQLDKANDPDGPDSSDRTNRSDAPE